MAIRKKRFWFLYFLMLVLELIVAVFILTRFLKLLEIKLRPKIQGP